MAATPIVSAEQVSAVTDAYLDRMVDLARRLDVPAAAVAEVTRRAATAMVDACAGEPGAVLDVLGRWAANIAALADRVRAGLTTGMSVAAGPVAATGAESPGTRDVAAVTGAGEARTTATALGRIDPRGRLALLVRDSYDAPPGALAVALGVTPSESQAVVADARLALMAAMNGRPTPTLAGHDATAVVSLATLGAMADGSADDDDPAVRLRRRHVGGCQACAAVLDAQSRARVVMAGLPVLGLPDETRAPTLTAILSRAAADLPSAKAVEAAAWRGTRTLSGTVIGLALAVALVAGGGVGAILRHSKMTAGESPTPGSGGLIFATPTPTPTGAKPHTPAPSVSGSFPATPSFLRSYVPSATPTSARPTPSTARPRKTAPVRRKPTATRTPAKTAPPVSMAPTTAPAPVSVAPTTPAAPVAAVPTTAAPTTAPPTSSPPTTSSPTATPSA